MSVFVRLASPAATGRAEVGGEALLIAEATGSGSSSWMGIGLSTGGA
jgi:hypothetical protein